MNCIFCRDTRVEPGQPGACVWCQALADGFTPYTPAQMQSIAAYRLVPANLLLDLAMLIDPPPTRIPDPLGDKMMVFKNPHAAETLTRISAIVRAMINHEQPQDLVVGFDPGKPGSDMTVTTEFIRERGRLHLLSIKRETPKCWFCLQPDCDNGNCKTPDGAS